MSENIKVTVIGAAGRMGRLIIETAVHTDGIKVIGAIESHQGIIGDIVPGTEDMDLAIISFTSSSDTSAVSKLFQESDVIIDFSSAEAVATNVRLAQEVGKAFITGVTGLSEDTMNIIREVSLNIPCVVAPNMSVGVNLLFKLVREAVAILGDDYDVEISEIHHRFKKDAPSGTANRLAEIIAEECDVELAEQARYGRQGFTGERTSDEIGIHAQRVGDVVGEHTVVFGNEGERVELAHKAHSRMTFVNGVIRAIKWIADQEFGLYDMQDVLGLR